MVTTVLRKSLFWLCISSVMVVPISIDVFISAFPIMKQVFNTTHIGWVISIFLSGLAISQLFYGPLSDRYGRKPVLLGGLFIYILGGGLSLMVTTFPLFLLARFVQAIGACSAIVSSLAIVRDTMKGDSLVHTIGIVMSIIGVCPAVAPLLGSFLTTGWGWEAGFVFLLLLGLFYFVIISLFFHETHQEKNLKAMHRQYIIANYLTLFRNKRYVLFCFLSALSYGVLFTYLSLASLYIVKQFHFSMIAFGWIVFIIGGIIFTVSLLVPNFAVRYGLPKVVLWGTSFILLGGGCMVLANLLAGGNVYTFMVPMAVVTVGIGMIRPTASAGAMMQASKKVSGSASAGYNFISFVGGSLCSAFSGFMHNTPLIFAFFVLAMGLLAFTVASFNVKVNSET